MVNTPPTLDTDKKLQQKKAKRNRVHILWDILNRAHILWGILNHVSIL